MSGSSVRVNSVGGDLLLSQINRLRLDSGEQRKILRALGTQVRKQAQQRIRRQSDIDGSKFAPRRRQGDKHRLLASIAKSKFLKVIPQDDGVTVTWANAGIGRVARAQQEGYEETTTASQQKTRNAGKQSDWASAALAESLLEAGFVLLRPNGVRIRPDAGWIMQNMSRARAGFILKKLRGGSSKMAWVIPGTPRSFLGATQADVNTMSIDVVNKILSNVKSAR